MRATSAGSGGRAGGAATARVLIVAAIATAIVALLWWVARWGADREREPRIVVLYGFSTLDRVMEDGLLPAFRARWLDQRGEAVEFVTAFAGSGAITDRIIAKYPAEVAVLSSELDAYHLAYSAVRFESWRELPHRGVVSRSPLVIVVRAGNPKGIREFADLAGEGVAVVESDPATSGVANWSILAIFGAALRRTGDPARAEAELAAVWRNVVTRSPSAREARLRFAAGTGDALLTYEQEALGGSPGGRLAGEIVYPPATILTEHVVTRVDKNIAAAQRPLIDGFLDFLWSREAQRILVEHGFRSVDDELNAANPRLGAVGDLFTLADLGGAAKARREILGAVWRDRVKPQLGR